MKSVAFLSETCHMTWWHNGSLTFFFSPNKYKLHPDHQPPSSWSHFSQISSETMLSCTICHDVFETRGQRDNHVANCSSHITVYYPNGPVKIGRNEEGQFVCYCAYKSCPKSYKNARTIRNHIAKVSLPWIGPPTVNPRSSSPIHCLLTLFSQLLSPWQYQIILPTLPLSSSLMINPLQWLIARSEMTK